mgnify:FL=1
MDENPTLNPPGIECPAQVQKVQTLVDGGLRLTLDLPETAIPQAAMLMEIKREGAVLIFEARVDRSDERR